MAIVSFPLSETGIVSIWTEALVYGILLPIFWTAIYVLVWRKKKGDKVSKPMLITAVLMFALATAHLGVDGYRMMYGYVFLGAQPNGPSAFFKDMNKPTFSAKYSIYVTQILVGDAFNIYRAWLVWQRNPWIPPGPIVLWAASAASGYYATAYLFSTADSDDSIFDDPYATWITTFYSIALAQNLISTCLIAYRLWARERRLAGQAGQRMGGVASLLPIVHIVLESAAIYLCAQIVLLVLYSVNDNAQYIILESLTSLTAMIFCFVIIRVAGFSQPFLSGNLPSSPPSSVAQSV